MVLRGAGISGSALLRGSSHLARRTANPSSLRRGLPRSSLSPASLASPSSLNSIASSRTLFTRSAPANPVKSFFTNTFLIVGGVLFVAYYLDSRSAIHRWVAIPLLKTFLDPESAQGLAIKMLASGIGPRDLFEDDEVLNTEIFGKRLSNPIGLAAGFDKQAEAIDGLFNLGFGIVEVGSVTPEPQPGNPQPRYFRLVADNAAINRFGFNSEGHNVILGRLRDRIRRWLLHESNTADLRISNAGSKQAAEKLLATHPESGPAIAEAAGLPKSLHAGKLLSINLGKNKTSAETDVSDYVKGVHKLGPYADMIVVNVSSPNTPGLRRLQRRGVLNDLLKQVVAARNEMLTESGARLEQGKPGLTTPLLVKIAPDLDETQLQDVADAVLESGVDGIIISNTTIQRPKSLVSTTNVHEQGGLSGPPLKPLSIKALSAVRERVGPEFTIIGCGGIYTAEDALDFAKAGATAVQLYTSFGYEGVGHPRRLKDDLIALLKKEGKTWKQMVGSGIDPNSVRETKAKSNVELEDLYRRETASLKAKLEDLRLSISGSDGKDATNVTALPYFQPDPNDVEYVTLLKNVHDVLGGQSVWDESLKAYRPTTRGEELDSALDNALADPEVTPLTGSSSEGKAQSVAAGKDAIAAQNSKRGGSIWSLLLGSKKDGQASSSNDDERSKYLVGMDGPRPDYKAADKLRVV